MEQLVARWAHNPKVVGSSPAPATRSRFERIGFFILRTHLLWYRFTTCVNNTHPPIINTPHCQLLMLWHTIFTNSFKNQTI